MKARLVIAIVVSVLFTLRALAYATPPDPAWIAGFWDNADHDDMVALAMSAAGIAELYPLAVVAPPMFVIATAIPNVEAPDLAPPLGPHNLRDPPS